MKKIITFVFSVLLFCNSLSAQITVEELNSLLDTRPYFGFRVDYNSNLTLPDSVKQKFLTALSGRLTPHLQDSLLALTPWQKEIFLEQSYQECKGDSACIEQTYQRIISEVWQRNNNSLMNRPVSGQLVLAAGSWNIREAIPILENAIGNERYGERAILMALAKLGNDSIKQVLMEKYTLSYILKNTELDTINDNNLLYKLPSRIYVWPTYEGIETALYLKSKEMLLNILELIYLRGLSGFCFDDCHYFPKVSFFVDEFLSYHFRSYSDFQIIQTTGSDYRTAIWRLSNRNLNEFEQRELDRLLSTEYRTEIKNQIRDWIIENVNFDE